MEHQHDAHPMTFERILLKFEKMHAALVSIKNIFHEFATTNGDMSLSNLTGAMKKLHGSMTEDEVKDLFDFVDVDDSHSISLKEFLACLTIGIVLNKFGTEKITDDGHSDEIKEMLNLIVSAYLLFDVKGEGLIRKTQVEKILEEAGKKKTNNSMLSQQRWQQMDWDGNGTIDFAEFIHAFSTWVDVEEE